MNSHNRLHYRPPAAASSAFPYASGGEQSAMVSAGVASCAPRGSIVPEPTKPVPRRVDTNRAVPHPNEPSLTVTAHEPAVPQQSFKPSHTNEPEPCANPNEPESCSEAKRTRASSSPPTESTSAAVLQTLAHERTRAVPQPNEPEPHRHRPRSRRPAPDLMARGHERTKPCRIQRTRASPWHGPPRCSASGRPAAATDSYGPMDRTNERLTANG
jgi:hypothetical protein